MEKWGPSVNLGHLFFNIQELIGLGKLRQLNLTFVPIEANYAAEWALVVLVGNSCPAFQDTHLPREWRVVGNNSGCSGSDKTRIYFLMFLDPGRQKLEWPVLKSDPGTHGAEEAQVSLYPHLWEVRSWLNDQWYPLVNCMCANLTDRLNHHISLSSAHTSRLLSSLGSSWGTDWGSHLSSGWAPIPEKKPSSQTRVGIERKGSSMRHRKVGLSTWMETPNRMRILSED